MHRSFAVTSIESPLGELGLLAGEHGLMMLSLNGPLDSILPRVLRSKRDTGKGRLNPWQVLEQAHGELVEYLLSAREKFETPLDLSCGTEFQRAVWRRLQRVPFGRTVSYSELADAAGKPGAARAVGNAVGANPLPIFVPCHRVLAAGGKLGGFSGGLWRKKQLLAIESSRNAG